MQQDAHKRALIAGSIGNFIEWYEFAVYGFLATVIARNFFQLEGEAELTSLILTRASFAIAFFFRPLGAVVFGRIGDRIGRKPTLIIVLVLMTLATAAIGIVPVYASIGIAAPLIVTLLRILQGLFAGGEYGGAVSLMTEFAPRGKRGLYGAWQSFTVALGLLAGAGIVALLSALLSLKPCTTGAGAFRSSGVADGCGRAMAAGEHGRDAELCAATGKTGCYSGHHRRHVQNHPDGHWPRDGLVCGGLYLSGDYADLSAICATHRF